MPELQVIGGPMKGITFDLAGETAFVGRSSKNDIQIKDATISRKQIKIYRIGEKLFLEDLKSTNGTWLNHDLVTPGEGFELGEGDVISLGNTVILVAGIPSVHPPLVDKEPPPSQSNATKGRITRPEGERREGASRNLELIYSVSKIVRSAQGLRGMMEAVLDSILQALPRVDRAAVILLDEKNAEKKDTVSRSRKEGKQSAMRYSRSVVDRVIREGKAVRMSDTNYETTPDFSASISTLRIGSLLCVPLVSREKTRGILYVDSLSGPYGFRKDDLLLLNAMSGSLALAIENAQLKGD